MITRKQLDLFIKFDGDIDGYSRMKDRIPEDKRFYSDDWSIVGDLIHRIHLCHNNLVSAEFAEKTQALLQQHLQNDDDIDLLKRYALGEIKAKSWWKFW